MYLTSPTVVVGVLVSKATPGHMDVNSSPRGTSKSTINLNQPGGRSNVDVRISNANEADGKRVIKTPQTVSDD